VGNVKHVGLLHGHFPNADWEKIMALSRPVGGRGDAEQSKDTLAFLRAKERGGEDKAIRRNEGQKE
jgi:hypothetical protein